jgi:hypothetical protein
MASESDSGVGQRKPQDLLGMRPSRQLPSVPEMSELKWVEDSKLYRSDLNCIWVCGMWGSEVRGPEAKIGVRGPESILCVLSRNRF